MAIATNACVWVSCRKANQAARKDLKLRRQQQLEVRGERVRRAPVVSI